MKVDNREQLKEQKRRITQRIKDQLNESTHRWMKERKNKKWLDTGMCIYFNLG